MGFTVKKDSEIRVLRWGSEKGVSKKCPERPLEEYDPLGVHPIFASLQKALETTTAMKGSQFGTLLGSSHCSSSSSSSSSSS